MEFVFIALMEKKKKVKTMSICHSSSFSILSLFSRKAVKEASANFLQENKRFINYVFCRNWAVRNPTGTRLYSSSPVNKQFESNPPVISLA